MLESITAIVAATLVTVPLLGFYSIYYISMKITQKKHYSFKLAADYTVILFMISVYFLLLEVWDLRLGWMFLLFLLISAIIFTFFYWEKYEDIDIQRVFKGVWRFQFVVFILLYFALISYGLFSHVFL